MACRRGGPACPRDSASAVVEADARHAFQHEAGRSTGFHVLGYGSPHSDTVVRPGVRTNPDRGFGTAAPTVETSPNQRAGTNSAIGWTNADMEQSLDGLSARRGRVNGHRVDQVIHGRSSFHHTLSVVNRASCQAFPEPARWKGRTSRRRIRMDRVRAHHLVVSLMALRFRCPGNNTRPHMRSLNGYRGASDVRIGSPFRGGALELLCGTGSCWVD